MLREAAELPCIAIQLNEQNKDDHFDKTEADPASTMCNTVKIYGLISTTTPHRLDAKATVSPHYTTPVDPSRYTSDTNLPFYPQPCPSQQAHNNQNVQSDDALIFPTVPFEAFGPDVALQAGAHVVIGMFEFGALAHFKALIEAELTRAGEAWFGWIGGGVEGNQGGIGLEAGAFAKVKMARIAAWGNGVGSCIACEEWGRRVEGEGREGEGAAMARDGVTKERMKVKRVRSVSVVPERRARRRGPGERDRERDARREGVVEGVETMVSDSSSSSSLLTGCAEAESVVLLVIERC